METSTPDTPAEQPAEITTPLAKAILDRLFAIESQLAALADHGPLATQLDAQGRAIVGLRCAVEQLRQEISQQQRVARAALDLHQGDPARPARA